jgi:DNA ligase (NAD+)
VIQNVDSAPDWGGADFITTAKLDGAAISILYGGGEIQKALTRGDGIEGLDITPLIKTLVPNKINYNEVVQISGEVVAPKEIPNARNYAAGALNLKDSKEFATRDLTFVAHGVSPYITDNYVSDMREISNLGFDTAIDSDYTEFPHDGLVFRVAVNKVFDEQGYTSHHPRGAYALKKQETGVVTVLQNVTWQVGKSGAVSPVAHFEPIDIEGATVSKATLHNKSIIEALNLELGCKIEVIRAGKIIPQVVRRVD